MGRLAALSARRPACHDIASMELDSRSWSVLPSPSPLEPSSFRWLQPGELLAFPVPTAALELDTLLRHLEVDGEFGDWPGAATHLAQARATWDRLAPALTARLGERTLPSVRVSARRGARAMTRALDQAARAVTASSRERIARHARSALAQIESIERVFE